MNPMGLLARWLDIRSNEVRTVILSFFGAFIVIGFLILARSLREALYLTSFDVKTLPYITASVAILGLPTVAVFTKLLARYNGQWVLKGVLALFAVGLAILWPFLNQSRSVIVIFYLWTSLGTLVLTSGFWVVTSELFPLRSAKRLFGLISAGGTTGAMVIGTSLSWLTHHIEITWLVPGLIGMLILFLLIQVLLPSIENPPAKVEEKTSIPESFKLVWTTRHLRLIALVVATATLATTLLDYQFKEIVTGTLHSKEELTSFFGAFYGWTGLASLLIQLLIASRLLSSMGVGVTLAVLPMFLLIGSASFLVLPALWMATAVRGADNSLRKSLHRAVLEILYVPVPSILRRKTKTFIDSVVDSAAEGIGAGIIFLWVTLANFPSMYLSVGIISLSLVFLSLCRKINGQYLTTLKERLAEGAIESDDNLDRRFEGRDLLSATFTFIDLRGELKKRGLDFPIRGNDEVTKKEQIRPTPNALAMIQSSEMHEVIKALGEEHDWNESHVPHLVRLLAKDHCYRQAGKVLCEIGVIGLPHLTRSLKSAEIDFVIRRRIPRILARIDHHEADQALTENLSADRFEIRYRTAIALMKRRREGKQLASVDWESAVWTAIRFEVNHEKPVWEMQRLLDKNEDEDRTADSLIHSRVGIRGELSLEHTFRLLALVLDAKHIRTSYQGILMNDEKLQSYALEYLEHVLPRDIRERLWPFIGDISEHQQKKSERPIDDVVSDLMTTGATLFGDEASKKALKQALNSDANLKKS